jgi:hypothetical protein
VLETKSFDNFTAKQIVKLLGSVQKSTKLSAEDTKQLHLGFAKSIVHRVLHNKLNPYEITRFCYRLLKVELEIYQAIEREILTRESFFDKLSPGALSAVAGLFARKADYPTSALSLAIVKLMLSKPALLEAYTSEGIQSATRLVLSTNDCITLKKRIEYLTLVRERSLL